MLLYLYPDIHLFTFKVCKYDSMIHFGSCTMYAKIAPYSPKFQGAPAYLAINSTIRKYAT